jgi:hypothetical protein
MAELNEITPKPLSTELEFDVLDGPSQKILNEKPLPEEEALRFVRQLQESDAARPLVMRSRRAILQE